MTEPPDRVRAYFRSLPPATESPPFPRISELLASPTWDPSEFRAAIPPSLQTELWFREQVVDMLLEGVAVLVAEKLLSETELATFVELKSLLQVQDGDFLKFRMVRVMTLTLTAQMETSHLAWEPGNALQAALRSISNLSEQLS